MNSEQSRFLRVLRLDILRMVFNHKKSSDIQTERCSMEAQSHYFSIEFSLLLCGQSPRSPCRGFLERRGAVSRQVPTTPGGGRRSRMDEKLLSHGPTFSWEVQSAGPTAARYVVKLPSLVFCVAAMVPDSRAGPARAQGAPGEGAAGETHHCCSLT